LINSIAFDPDIPLLQGSRHEAGRVKSNIALFKPDPDFLGRKENDSALGISAEFPSVPRQVGVCANGALASRMRHEVCFEAGGF